MTMSYNQKVALFCTKNPEWQLVDFQQTVHYKKNVLNSVVCTGKKMRSSNHECKVRLKHVIGLFP